MTTRVGLIVALTVAISAPHAAAAVLDAGLLDAAGDRVLRVAFIPSDKNVHGEVRLVRRGPALCVQTLLYSPALRRGLRRIRKKELYSWPEDREGYADSTLYLEQLELARARVLERFDRREDRSDPRQKLLIEFVLSDSAAFYAFHEVEISGEPPQVTLRERHPMIVQEASRTYVGRAMALMLRSAFGEGTDLPESLKEPD